MIAQTQKNCLNVVGYMRRKKENNRNIVHEARRTLCLTLTIAGFIFICICGANALAATRQSTKQQTQNSAPLGNRVTTENGEIRGVARDSQGVLVYKGIPYASAPVGPFRWQPPQPPKSWEGVRDASALGHRCWVNVPNKEIGGAIAGIPEDEDCLYLNVWTAAKSASERRPVMVWLHGGGFQFGTSGERGTDGTLLAQKGVILVSLNYRLGVFGFFSYPTLRREGNKLSVNFGLQDQIAALKWVKANIAEFGGDPNNVTVFGESAGSQAVSLLMSSPLAKGLFQRAIGESGSSLQSLPDASELSIRGAAFAGALGAKSLDDLRAISAERLNTAAMGEFQTGATIIFAPAIDGYVLPEQVTTVFEQGKQNDVSLIAGYNRREEFLFLTQTLPHSNAAEFRTAAERVFGASKMKEFALLYPCNTDAESKISAEQLYGDIRQKAETWQWLVLQSRTGKSGVYGYQFSYESPYSPVASHTADIVFVFGNLVHQFFAPKSSPADESDRILSEQMMSYWTNFARTGDPNGQGLPHWPSFRSDHSMLQIEANGQITQSPPTTQQIARFKFLQGFLVSASTRG
jgi:para-nitrobenzyl esterase